jgi:hypothetical protein
MGFLLFRWLDGSDVVPAIRGAKARQFAARRRSRRARFFFREFCHQRSGLLFQNLAATREILLAMPDILAHDRFEIVDVVEINVVEPVNLWINVTRHGDIDHE